MTNKSQVSSRAQEQALLQKLLHVPMFSRLSGQQMQVLVKAAKPKMAKPEEVLWNAGDPCKGIYILLKGRLALREEGKETQVVQPIAAIGEVTSLTGTAHANGAVATEVSLLLEIPHRLFELLLMRNTSICQVVCRNIIGGISAQLQAANDRIGGMQGRKQALAQRLKDAESELNALRIIKLR